MNRRSYLRSGCLVTALGVAGCLGSGDGDDGGPVAANEYGYETKRTDGVDVPLVPVTDAYEWYDDEDVVYADARDRTAYEASRIEGAVYSPAPDGQDGDDPLGEYPPSTTVVTYCMCPHHLSTMRAATLIEAGYAHTYAIDDGLQGWLENDYPAAGEDAASLPDAFTVEGRTDPSSAGDRAWIRHDPTGQREVTPIESDGRFEMDVRFHDVGPETTVRLSTPDADVTDALGSLASGVVEV